MTLHFQNDDNSSYFSLFRKTYDHPLHFNCEEIIMGRDLSLVLGINKDKKGGQQKTHLSIQ